MRLFIILLLFSAAVQAENNFVYGSLGIGAYDRNHGRPEINTPNMLGRAEVGIGREFDDSLDIRLGLEHWSSLQGFPKVFNSPDEDGHGFNGLWLKIEKRLYF